MPKYPTVGAGIRVTAQVLSDIQMPAVVTTDTAAVSNSTTLAADTQLTLPLEANASYMVEIVACFDTNGAGNCDLKTDWTVPTGATGYRSRVGSTNSATAGSFTSVNDTNMQMRARSFDSVSTYQMSAAGPTTDQSIYETGVVHTGPSAGNVTLRFAQDAAVAIQIQRLPGSFIRAIRFA